MCVYIAAVDYCKAITNFNQLRVLGGTTKLCGQNSSSAWLGRLARERKTSDQEVKSLTFTPNVLLSKALGKPLMHTCLCH